MNKVLTKSDTNRVLTGVLGGIGEYFGIDPTLVRLAYCALSVFSAGFPGLVLYIIMAVIVPNKA